MHKILGIDIGGTNIKLAVFDVDGNMLNFREEATPQIGGPTSLIASICTIIESLNENLDDVIAIGAGIPGPVDRFGVIHKPPNLHAWGDVDFAQMFEEFTNFPKKQIAVGNDANFAGIAEFKSGHGINANPLVMITLGTGIGGCVIIDGKLLLGRDGYAAELGHTVIDPAGPRCSCGRRGCAEAIIGRTGIIKTAWNVLHKNKGSLVWSMLEGDFGALDPLAIAKAADMGDPAACEITEKISNSLGMFLADIINIFNPEKIVIGGGISKWGDPLLEPAKQLARKQALAHLAKNTKIIRAKFSEKAGVIGAYHAAVAQINNTDNML